MDNYQGSIIVDDIDNLKGCHGRANAKERHFGRLLAQLKRVKGGIDYMPDGGLIDPVLQG